MVTQRDFARAQGRPVQPRGGIDLKNSPSQVQADSSPETENILLHTLSASRRGGFPQLVRQTPMAASLRNYGYHTKSLASSAVGAPQADALIVPGALYAGHRPVWEELAGAMTIEFFFRCDDQTITHVGTGDPPPGTHPPAPAAQSAPFTIKFRPILSKGPIKRTADQVSAGPTASGAHMRWQTTNRWGGAAATHAMPFLFGIRNFTSGGVTVWKLDFAHHAFDPGSGNWQLIVVTSSIFTIETGITYHVIGSYSDSAGIARLRVGQLTDAQTIPTYTYDTLAYGPFTKSLATPCPIQVFDCPMEIMDAPVAGTPTVPPGLFNVARQDGSYFFNARRFEGAVEEITVHVGDLLSSVASTLDRSTKYDPQSLPATVRQHWSMTEPGMDYVQEMTGQGNHLYLSPRGPIFDPLSGSARPKGSWWFNGQTSYALAKLGRNIAGIIGSDDGNPNWRYQVTTRDEAAMQAIVHKNLPHGLHVVFTPDSENESFEQVVAEMHSVLRLAINTDGTIVGYCRDASTNNGAIAIPVYQAQRVQSSGVVKAGERYEVTLLRDTAGTRLRLFINGALDGSNGAVLASDVDSQPISGLTIGAGSFRATTYTTDIATPILPSADTGTNEDINTDHRSHFCGRIEQVAVIVGNGKLPPVYSDPGAAESRIEQARLWESPVGGPVRTLLQPDDPNDLVSQEIGVGGVVTVSGDTQINAPILYAIEDAGVTNPRLYSLPSAAPVGEELLTFPDGGADTVARQVIAWFILGRWVLNADDRDERDHGRYLRSIELRNHVVTGGVRRYFNEHRAIHVQGSVCQDDLGVLAALQKRCTESDQMTEADAQFTLAAWQHRNRPYMWKHPTELGPAWAEGIVFPRADANPITLLTAFEPEKTGERLLIAAASRQLYWVRDQWRLDSPFAEETTTRVPFAFGQPDSFARVPGTVSQQEFQRNSGNSLEIHAWIKPFNLHGWRTLLYKGNLAGRFNFSVFFQDGSLNVMGTMGATQAYWLREGYLAGGVYVPRVTTMVNRWNEITIRMNSATNTITAVVNGLAVTFVLNPGWTALGTAASDAANYPLYLMGVPLDGYMQRVAFNPPNVQSIQFAGFCGLVTDVSIKNVLGTGQTVSRTRQVDGANVFYLLPLNEGTGWTVTQNAALAPGNGELRLDELVLLKQGLDESRGAPYRSVVYRDRLYITNGRSVPLSVRFRRFSHPEGAFSVQRLGMREPFMEINVEPAFRAGATYATGNYQVFMAFENEDGVLSEPVNLVTQNPGGTFASLYLNRLPRAFDGQVVARQFYLNASGGGGAPLLAARLPDNESWDWEIAPPSVGLAVEATGRKLPAPRARGITVGQGSLWMIDLTEIEAGQNAFAVSDGEEVIWWPSELVQFVDSRDGKRVASIEAQLGRVYLFKRDSSWQENLAGASLPVPTNVNASVGLAGGVTIYDNLLFGAGDKGIYAFDGTSVQYQSLALEGDYRTIIDLDDEGLRAMSGAQWWPNSQYWISMRETGRESNRLIYVLHTDIGLQIGQQPQHAWTKLRVPEHTSMASLLDARRKPILLLGTVGGQILKYNEDLLVDAAAGEGTLVGTATSTSGTTLTMAGATFDQKRNGLRGATIEITDGTNVYTRTIERNTVDTITWIDPIAGLGSTPSFIIGGYDSFWTTPWLSLARFGSATKAQQLDLDYEPQIGSLLDCYLQAVSGAVTPTRAFPIANSEYKLLSLDSGYMQSPFRITGANRGRYVRLRFGQKKPLMPFSVNAWQIRGEESGQRGSRSAT